MTERAWLRSITAIVSVAVSVLACAPAPAPREPHERRPPEPPGPIRHVLVVSIDGLLPDTYLRPEAHGLRVPVLRSLVARGASSDGVRSVFPSLTYPAHTTIASGVLPLRHGVHGNKEFDPLDKNLDAWRWYSEDVKVPRVWDLAFAAGYRTALIDWPVTVGAKATYHVPEFWRAKVPADVKLIGALSTPGLLEGVAATYSDFSAGFRPQDVADEAGMDIALYVVERAEPHLLFLHIWQVDAMQHKFGLWSPEALAAIENADRQLGRLLEGVERAGIASDTALVVVSDHGFENVTRMVKPGALLRQAGLVTLDAAGKVSAWRAAVLTNHGTAYVYVEPRGDAALEALTTKVLEEEMQATPSSIARLYRHDEIVGIGGDPEAFLALEATPGTFFAAGYDTFEAPPAYKATHGYDPARPEMLASLVLFGPGVPHQKLSGARLVDVAPTVAGWLGLRLSGVDGRPLVGTAAP